MVELLRSPRRLLLFVFELCLVGMFVLAAACIRLGIHDGLTYPDVGKKAAVTALVFGFSFYYSGLYDFASITSTRTIFERVLQSLPLAMVALLVVFYIVPPLEL